MPLVKVLIVGGHGQVAQQITKQLVAAGTYAVHSLIRNPDQAAEIEKLGAVPVVQDLETADVPALVGTLGKFHPDVVVWAAGAGYRSPPDRIDAVDHLAAVRLFDAQAVAAGGDRQCGRRLVSISALDIRDREARPVPDWYDDADRARSELIWRSIGAFLGAKFQADRALRTGNGRRTLDYTMVRPGGLSNDAGRGAVAAGKVHLGSMISREDVASVVVACIENPETIGLAFDVVGGDVDVRDAVKSVGEQKTDTFEGYY